MSLSIGKLGKLHAICDRLQKTQEEDGSNGWTENYASSPKAIPDAENNNVPEEDLDEESLCPSRSRSPEIFNLKRKALSESSGRRKNRKSAAPRNLTQVSEYLEQFAEEKDELSEYKINNQDTDFPPIDPTVDEMQTENNNNNTVDVDDNWQTERKTTSRLSNDISVSCEKDITDDGVLDLSVNKVTNNDKNDESACENDSRPNVDEAQSASKDASSRNGGEVDVSVLKSYAERTMNEFLSMYGFHGDAHDALTSELALRNYALAKMFPQSAVFRQNGAAIYPYSIPTSEVAQSLRLMSANMPMKPSTNGHPLQERHPLQNGTLLTKPSNVDVKVSYANSITASIANPSPSVIGSVIPPLVSITPLTPSSSDQLLSTVNSPTKLVLPDYSKYIRRYNSAQECGINHCYDLGYREHFHCMDCNFKVFVRKEEMIRHFKWHKKRDDSLQHGFMRYSPMDDCSKEFGVCTHNGRQTHYHCLQSGCDKVYISTSDVQMHANYHRKDSAIIQEGFQRFRATEDCGTPTCSFYGQRTTHFHCRRQDCHFTFKNKADMEKHKSYHQKDEILGRDGFKKFMKYEHCPYSSCRFSKISNHIHCIRPGCDYVLHSTGQLYSHKRKHERRDFESAYRRFKDNQKSRPTMVSTKQERTLHPAFGGTPKLPIPRLPLFPRVSSTPHLSTNEVQVKQEEESLNRKESYGISASEENSLSGSTSPVSMATSIQSETKTDSQISIKTEPGIEDGDVSDSNSHPATGLAAYNDEISGDQLNDSLTLPIPKYSNDTVSTPQTSPQISPKMVYAPNQSPPKTPLPLAASGLSTPAMLSPAMSTSSVNSTNSATGRDWAALASTPSERKPRDDSWKAYIERFTANDPCHSRCQYLYKDHYHCKVENCTVLFKSKDAVREHARYHELQERITAMAYTTVEKDQTCPAGCERSIEEKHYHCIWAGCSQVILDSGPIFNRLEHYRIHEYARASAGKNCKASGSPTKLDAADFGKRRRGRPPKYPKSDIPIVPKVELSEEEMVTLNRMGLANQDRLFSSFKKFEADQPCPDELCLFYGKSHFHCARPRCHHASDREDVLNLHTKDFHSFVDILEGFEFFDRNVNCRRLQCHNNKANRHYHCIRPKCDYSFVRHTTMNQHNKKHSTESEDSLEKLPLQTVKKDVSNFVPIAPAPGWSNNKTVVKAAGTFYPISTINNGLRTSVPMTTTGVQIIPSSTLSSTTSLQMAYSPSLATSGVPLSVLLQKPGNQIPLPSWSTLRAQMHYTIQQNCARPFCKLKKKDHYHCLECNQAFSDPARLRSHIGKHGIKLERVDSGLRVNKSLSVLPKQAQENPMLYSEEPENLSLPRTKHYKDDSESQSDDPEGPEDLSARHSDVTASSSLNLDPTRFSNMVSKTKMYSRRDTSDEEDTDLSDDETSRKRPATELNDFSDSDCSASKHQKLSSSKEDDGIAPQGYTKYKFLEDCGFDGCVYRKTLTHYHCDRSDCGYSFSNRTRVVQHTQRHDRIDGITGDEFRQFRGNIDCYYPDCGYRNRSSHFHCLLCSYICMDAAQVMAHRKNHQKMNKITSQGFQKFSGSEDCQILTCTYYYKKQTHYHCTEKDCSYVVLSPSQMPSHKMKHSRDSLH